MTTVSNYEFTLLKRFKAFLLVVNVVSKPQGVILGMQWQQLGRRGRNLFIVTLLNIMA